MCKVRDQCVHFLLPLNYTDQSPLIVTALSTYNASTMFTCQKANLTSSNPTKYTLSLHRKSKHNRQRHYSDTTASWGILIDGQNHTVHVGNTNNIGYFFFNEIKKKWWIEFRSMMPVNNKGMSIRQTPNRSFVVHCNFSSLEHWSWMAWKQILQH